MPLPIPRLAPVTNATLPVSDLDILGPHISRFIIKLRHQDPVTRRVSGGKTGQGRRQLIAEDKDHVANAGHQKSHLDCMPLADLGVALRFGPVMSRPRFAAALRCWVMSERPQYCRYSLFE